MSMVFISKADVAVSKGKTVLQGPQEEGYRKFQSLQDLDSHNPHVIPKLSSSRYSLELPSPVLELFLMLPEGQRKERALTELARTGQNWTGLRRPRVGSSSG